MHLFEPSPAVRFRGGRDNDAFQGENPPAGAIVYYQLAQAQKDEITLEILDGAAASCASTRAARR